MAYKFTIISFGNTKLNKDGIVSINMPPILTCPSAGECKKYCYALVGQQAMGNAKNFRLRNFELYQSDPKLFEEKASFEIKKCNRRIIRWMDSGDIMSLAFLEMMVRIAKEFPEVKFYAYTKSISIVLAHGWDNIPANLKLIQSYGGTEDHLIDESKPIARIFKTAEDIPEQFDNGSESDYLAATTGTKIAMIAHGSRKKQFIINN